MRTCDGCKYAEWQRTAAGKLHPSKEGKCIYPVKMPVLPISMYWIADQRPYGGWIQRGAVLKDHCPCHTKA